MSIFDTIKQKADQALAKQEGVFYEILGKIIGAVAPLIAGGAVVRSIEQASNITLPNEILDTGSLLEALKRGTVTKEYAVGEFLRKGLDSDKANILVDLVVELVGISDLINLAMKGVISREDFSLRAERLGVPKDSAMKLLEGANIRLDPLMVVQAWRRGFFKEGENPDFFNDLRESGWTDDRIEQLKKVTSFIPPPTDMIRFLMRDVYIPEFVQKFGMDKEYPESADADFAKIGIDHETGMKYWEAHWELPSISQAYEMYQRSKIDDADINRLLRAQGVEPYWRDKLIAVAFQPFTRIDIRRMNSIGVLDHDKTVRAYRDIGYSPEDAITMTKFTEKYNAMHPIQDQTVAKTQHAEFMGMTKAHIILAYEDKLLTKEKAIEFMKDIGVHGDVADLELNLADYKEYQKTLNDEISLIKDDYVLGTIDLTTATTQLSSLDITPQKLAHALAGMQRAKKSAKKLPTKADLDKWLKDGIIAIDEYAAELSLQGFSDKYVAYFVQEKGGIKP